MNFIDLPQRAGARGVVRLPGSKSISNRALLLAALASGSTEIRNVLESDDTERMTDALKALGVSTTPLGANARRVEGVGANGGGGAVFPVGKADLFLGNAGTAFRTLTAVLAFSGGHYRLHGVPRMHERPIGDLVDVLRALGAQIAFEGRAGYPPLSIAPRSRVEAWSVRVRGDVSSQFLSGLLIALPLIGGGISVEVEGDLISKPYVDLTLFMMARFGVEVVRDGWRRFTVPEGVAYRSPGTFFVEGDASSASYFLAAGAIGGGPVRVEGVGKDSIQGDVGFADALREMGAVVDAGDDWVEAAAPPGGLKGIRLDCNSIPDAAMTLAVAALFARGETRLDNIASWRVKETDRIAAMACELEKFGARVVEGDDFLAITPPEIFRFPPEGVDTYDDHRIAMCFSLASFAGLVRINDPSCVAKTFPDYFACFARVAEPFPVVAIDGPSASGKGTVAARAAAKLGWAYLDSGALYRLTALAAQRAGLRFSDEERVAALAAALDVTFGEDSILLSGEEVGEAIRDEAISSGASEVAALPSVREALLFRQRAFRSAPGLVADGRDMASVVFPDAQCKVFLTASVYARARRRYKQLIEKGISVKIDTLLHDMEERDARDSKRSVAPLRQSEGARFLDTTDLSIEEAVDRILDWCGAENVKCAKE
ncbi:MAG: bifunctional 3-phosphoshikimate 1-carboxyvinyltransferase/cytidylate kinase [Candidatus Accumulibacter sp.]|jgi:3-phosphoshikimate 1-carboxyvinyltransferase|nr:bifunctional 3-phosphoshikimate 1-carboxyvinyltransferase/cytidylate kinase [Accumulibacter sp.]